MSPIPAPTGFTPSADAVEALAAAVLACPAVAALSGGRFHQVATYLPGRRLEGVRVEEDRIVLSVVVVAGVPVIALDSQVRSAVAPWSAGRRVDLHVADLQLPDEQQLALPAGGASPADRSR